MYSEKEKKMHSYDVKNVLFSGDCLTWNATLAIRDNGFTDQIGTNIDRFCPEIRAKDLWTKPVDECPNLIGKTVVPNSNCCIPCKAIT